MRGALKFSIWNVLRGGDNRRLTNGIHSSEAFREIIAKEEGRVWRNHHCFTMAIFDFPNVNGSEHVLLRRLVDLLKERVRYTDEVGWINGNEVGVLLPETQTQGAKCFAEDVRRAMEEPGPPPSYRLFVYPEDINHDGNDPQQLLFYSIVPGEGA
jgi:GGDEF domain-containing protein